MSSDKRKEGVKYGYTTIQHDPRLKFDLSNDAYCVADAIYNLSNNPSSIAPGWCYSSRQSIADIFGISKRSVQRAINELFEKGLLTINAETNFLRTTQKWFDEFVQYQMLKNVQINRGDKLS
jgi:hypothetical protein